MIFRFFGNLVEVSNYFENHNIGCCENYSEVFEIIWNYSRAMGDSYEENINSAINLFVTGSSEAFNEIRECVNSDELDHTQFYIDSKHEDFMTKLVAVNYSDLPEDEAIVSHEVSSRLRGLIETKFVKLSK